MDWYSILYRSWYYFRIGYGTYLTFPLGYIGFLALIYTFFISPNALNVGIFSNVIYFEIVVAFAITPAGILIGYLHIKHTRVWTTEVDIAVESNPYVYKLAPGKEIEAYAPITLVTLQLLRKLAERDGVLSADEKKQILDLEQKMDVLLHGKYISKPKRRN